MWQVIDNICFDVARSQVSVWLPTAEVDHPVQLEGMDGNVSHPAAHQFEFALLLDVQQGEIVSEPVRIWDVATAVSGIALNQVSNQSGAKKKKKKKRKGVEAGLVADAAQQPGSGPKKRSSQSLSAILQQTDAQFESDLSGSTKKKSKALKE